MHVEHQRSEFAFHGLAVAQASQADAHHIMQPRKPLPQPWDGKRMLNLKLFH